LEAHANFTNISIVDFALYEGEDLGQGGASFELERVFSSRRKALAYIGSKPMAALEASNSRKRG